eukprot:1241312-Pleurochrysis_carterae.AAC.3
MPQQRSRKCGVCAGRSFERRLQLVQETFVTRRARCRCQGSPQRWPSPGRHRAVAFSAPIPKHVRRFARPRGQDAVLLLLHCRATLQALETVAAGSRAKASGSLCSAQAITHAFNVHAHREGKLAAPRCARD